MSYTIDPNQPHAAIPTEERHNTPIKGQHGARSASYCKWCGREVINRVAHMGQNNTWAHQKGAFTK